MDSWPVLSSMPSSGIIFHLPRLSGLCGLKLPTRLSSAPIQAGVGSFPMAGACSALASNHKAAAAHQQGAPRSHGAERPGVCVFGAGLGRGPSTWPNMGAALASSSTSMSAYT